MNWVGGTMSRIRGRDDKKIQMEFFEKKRYEKTLDTIPLGLQSPTKKKEQSISQDLLSLQTVLQTHREDSDRMNKPLKQPNKLDLRPKVGQKRTISHEVVQGGEGTERGRMTEGFQNLETPTSFLDLKRWRGENKPYKTLGMCKVTNLRHFQELEQTVYRREGVEVESEKENVHILKNRDDSLQVSTGGNLEERGVELLRDETRGSSIQWNNKVCGESNSVTDTKWLEFLHGCNKPRQQTQVQSENAQVDITTQFPSIHLPVSSSRPPNLANLEYYESEDLMEFERVNVIKPRPGNSEDPLYLTLTCNKDSFKGYKRPRIETNLGFTSSLGARPVPGGRSGGYLDESVFATPSDGNIVRPDGMLTENPFPLSHKVALRSIKDFVLERSPLPESEDSSGTEEVETVDEASNSPSVVAQPTISSGHNQEKRKFVAPFLSENKSLDVPTTASQEKRPPSKSYESFLNSLITSDETLRENNGRVEIRNVEMRDDSCMMSIMEWKAKERTLRDEDSNEIQADLTDKEAVERRGSCQSESMTRDENAESSHLEVELGKKELDCGNESRNEDENSIEFLSTHDVQGSDDEMEDMCLEKMLVQNLDIFSGEQEMETIVPANEMQIRECDTLDYVNEVIKRAIILIISSGASSAYDKQPLIWEKTIIGNTSLKITLQTAEISYETRAESIAEESMEKRRELDQSEIKFSQVKSLESDFDIDHIDRIRYPNQSINRITEENLQTKLTEYAEIAIQYSQPSPHLILIDTAVGSPLQTDSKYCQSVVRCFDKVCQTEDFRFNNMKFQDTQTDFEMTIPEKMLSQVIQTEEPLARADKELQTDLFPVLFPLLTDPAADFRNRDNREECESYILHQQQTILALEKEIEMFKQNDN